jgi:hypothetical protein
MGPNLPHPVAAAKRTGPPMGAIVLPASIFPCPAGISSAAYRPARSAPTPKWAFGVGASRATPGVHLVAPFVGVKPCKYTYIASRSVSLAKAEIAFQGIPSASG